MSLPRVFALCAMVASSVAIGGCTSPLAVSDPWFARASYRVQQFANRNAVTVSRGLAEAGVAPAQCRAALALGVIESGCPGAVERPAHGALAGAARRHGAREIPQFIPVVDRF